MSMSQSQSSQVRGGIGASEMLKSPAGVKHALKQVGTSLEIPSRPLLGFLPIKRVIPQDIHSIADYADGVICLSTILFANKANAKIAGAVLGVSVLGVSLLSDYRLSLAKVIPIEAHEAIDHLWGASCIAAPFVFGYYKKNKAAAITHIATGAFTILASLFTDYRAALGRGRSAVDAAAMQGARIQP